ncbi:hypothetical protein KIN20_016180 [Parelaphostrongylus tenuis]|uniref:Uncharacterized protein n=1 Tax=Parelaphostrongylus tenuis TaxID=148309 RepID=A0AAD5QSZ5_PARTN|nr:hypothetical protein KIN20_016180 [Parelaphostrongylus tenuis]
MNTASLPALPIPLLTTVTVVLGCGVMQQDQAMTRSFTASGFKLPTAMVFTASTSAPAQLPGGIATTSDGAKSLVSRLVMQTITDVLEQQGRSAGLCDAIISNILSQLMVQINYDPLNCATVTVNPKTNMAFEGDMAVPLPNCIVFDNTVTALCTHAMPNMCQITPNMNIGAIEDKHLSISGSLTTTNFIMANWSKEMWQSVVNRAVRILALGPFASHFSSAFGTVS